MLAKLFKKYYLQDELIGAAYEGLCPEARGWVKKTIASLYNYYGQPWPAKENIQLTRLESSSVTLKQAACELCLVIYDSNYSALTRALGAVCPACFAGVKNICTVAVHGQTIKPEAKKLKSSINPEAYFNNLASEIFPNANLNLNLLAAWELAGIEDMLALPQAELMPVLLKAQKHFSSLRIVVLGNPAWKNDILTLQLPQQSWVWTESPLVSILMQGSFPQKTIQTVKALHPDLKIKTTQSIVPSSHAYFAIIQGEQPQTKQAHESEQILNSCIQANKPDCACNSLSGPLSSFPFSSLGSPALVLDKNMAGCWLWPDLKLDFFKSNQVIFTI